MTDIDVKSDDKVPSKSERIYAALPYLRRYARAICGSQSSGDMYVAALLEAILADPTMLPDGVDLRVGLYAAFHRLWLSGDQPTEDFSRVPEDASEAVAQDRLSHLPPPTRQALLLTVVEEFSERDAAMILGMDTPLVRQLVGEAMAELDRQTRARVLIIEDEPIIAMDIEAIVKEAGHEVTRIADTRDKAISAAMQEEPDLILADLQLADGSSGLDAVSEIITRCSPPVIFITAYPERLLTGARPEPTFLISKPFLPETVKTAVSQALFFRQRAFAS